MRILAGILLLIVGVSYPMAVLYWLNKRMGRQPALLPRHISRILAFNGVLPVTLIALGLGLLSLRLWNALAFKVVLAFAGVATFVLLVLLAREWSVIRGHGGSHGRDAAGTGL